MVTSDPKCSKVTNKIDCHPEPDATEQKCAARGCCWKIGPGPWCFHPKGNTYITRTKVKITLIIIREKKWC